ncbi:hypothetical protein [Streptomyces sp. NPDC093060]|uniref:hypothetical protein n=1 Tax=Streptomyces sp. NPDC093060 TaxID=3366019 RepID=UPI0038117888
MGKDFTADQIGPIDIPRVVRRKAALYVASNAVGKADCTELLAMLGLLPASHPEAHRPDDHGLPGYRAGCRCKRCRKANANRSVRERTARREAAA